MYWSHARIWISNVLCRGHFCFQRNESDCLFCWYWWNWWPSLFTLSLHNYTDNWNSDGIATKIYFYNVNNKPLSPLKPGNPNNPWCPLSPLDPFVPLYPIWWGGKWSKNIYIHQNWHYMISWQTKRVWLTRLVSYKKQELLSLREYLSSPRVFCLVASVLLTFLGCLCCPSMCLYVLCFVL